MKLLQLFLLFMFCVCFASSARTAVFVGKQLVCKEYNRNYIYNLTCGLKLVNRNMQKYSLYLHVKPVVVDNVHFRLTTYYKFRTVYRPSGVLVNEDVCSYLKFLNTTTLISMNNFKNLMLPNFTCPIKGPFSYHLKDLELDSFRMPSFVNIGDWIFETVTYTIVDGIEIFLSNVKNYFGIRYQYTWHAMEKWAKPEPLIYKL